MIDTVDPQARIRNLLGLATDDHMGDQMFDQILASPEMAAFYVDGSASVFSHEDAARGNVTSRASDHLPVFADFIVKGEGVPPPGGTLWITRLLPDPAGTDSGADGAGHADHRRPPPKRPRRAASHRPPPGNGP